MPKEDRAKTLWDWLDLLLVPALLALGVWLLNRAAREREHQTELERSRDAALQTYLDRVSSLLRSEWHESGEGYLEANIIRAQTLTVLRQLDGRRNGLLFRFLRESGLMVREAVVTLRGADLSEAVQSEAYLRGADLFGAILCRADLSGADLSKAKVSDAQLAQAASLKGAIMPDGSRYE